MARQTSAFLPSLSFPPSLIKKILSLSQDPYFSQREVFSPSNFVRSPAPFALFRSNDIISSPALPPSSPPSKPPCPLKLPLLSLPAPQSLSRSKPQLRIQLLNSRVLLRTSLSPRRKETMEVSPSVDELSSSQTTARRAADALYPLSSLAETDLDAHAKHGSKSGSKHAWLQRFFPRESVDKVSSTIASSEGGSEGGSCFWSSL